MWLLGSFIVTWLMVIAFTYYLSTSKIERLFDEDMLDFGQAALNILAVTTSDERLGLDAGAMQQGIEASREAIKGLPLLHRGGVLAYALWYKGEPVLSSPNLPKNFTTAQDGFSSLKTTNADWRVLNMHQGDVQVWVGANISYRRQTMNLLLINLLFPLLPAFPLLALMIWFSVSRGLSPLQAVQAEVHKRSDRNLEPIALTRVPVEIHGLVGELNLLLERLRNTLEAERRLTGDAAHEIRTPLAALRTHVQVVLRSTDPQFQAHGLQQINRSVTRITTLMEQILLLARLDSDALIEEFYPVDLSAVAESVESDLLVQAFEKRITLSLEQTPVRIIGIELWLKILLRNLIANAIRYTPAGGHVSVRIEQHEQHALISVMDDGPGITAQEQKVIFKRFYRGTAASGDGQGSGLGLPIVKRIIEVHKGTILLSQGLQGRGLGVTVSLPKRI
ncbi:sensor histidine kinase [Pseudomonas sp. 5P_3.1_Bac2]|uniref:sensor histidine kinase n=1 Tax=Pseudomonas sp. 5P_3.1_Bac2 TaxID=2971617 RepID=UPI0021C9B98F|nr:ATP-binding protein [Pseudomonas sp. 5P_3.1_Bac2]MCU1719014.1 ATP-binding protein [Pseudomonas sp. 5P_3.1_Bac2]